MDKIKENRNPVRTVIIILSVVLMVLSYCIMEFTSLGGRGISVYNNGYGLFDMQFSGYSTQTVYDVLNQMGTEGIAHYKRFFIADYIFVISGFYAFFVLSLSMNRKNKHKWIGYVMAVATVIKAVADFVENTLLIIVMNSFPEECNLIINVSSVLTTIKFLAFGVFLLLLLLCLILRIAGRVSGQHKSSSNM